MSFDLDELLREAEEESKRPKPPVDVDVLLHDRLVTVRVPILSGEDFDAVAGPHCPHIAWRDDLGCWFRLEPVTRSHTGIVLVDGDSKDDLLEKRGDDVTYRWPAVYDALGHEDRLNLQATVWGIYVHEPLKLLAEARAKRAAQVEAKEGL